MTACRIDNSYILKIADFGMCREVLEKDYYRMDDMKKPMPIRWMSTESLQWGKFTVKSDVVGK